MRILDRKALKLKGITYSNAYLLRLEAAGQFPRRFRLGENRVAWVEAEIDAWLDARAAEREPGLPPKIASPSPSEASAGVLPRKLTNPFRPSSTSAASSASGACPATTSPSSTVS